MSPSWWACWPGADTRRSFALVTNALTFFTALSPARCYGRRSAAPYWQRTKIVDSPKRDYEMYVAADQVDQARAFLRQALSALRPDNTAYALVRHALDVVEAERRI